ncbi:MAG: phage/plasmid primase, P4 family [Verrucomicrobiota bacterium]
MIINELVTRLNAQKNGSGWMAQCPAHADRNPSLSISEGREGRILLKCFAGCSNEKIVSAMKLKMSDLMPPARMPRPVPTKPAQSKSARTFTSVEEAANRCTPQGATLEQIYLYPKSGQPFGAVTRYCIQEDKTFRQFHAVPGGWMPKAPVGKWPLYHDEAIPLDGPIYVVEGEKCQEAAAKVGLRTVSSAGGSKAAGKTDWSKLSGRTVIILPDHDASGESYADEVARILTSLNQPASVKIVQLPGLTNGQDIVDFLEAHDAQEPEAICAEIMTLAEKTSEWTPAKIWEDDISRLITKRNPLDLAREGHPLARTDTGLSERFAFYHGAEVAYQTESALWFVWDGKRWARDPGLVEIRRRLAETARKIKDESLVLPESMGTQPCIDYFRFAFSCEQVRRMDAAARLSPSLGLARPLAMFDADPMQFCVKNGTVDLRTGKLLPHKSEDLITRISSVDFIPDATDPTFRRFIEHVTGGDIELESYLQRAAGYTLTGNIHEKCLFIIYSEATDTGKTCFITALLTALGEYGMTIGFDALLEPDRGGQANYDIAKLCGTRLAIASETKPGRRFAAELIKQLTGGDTLRAREIRQSSIEFRPSHKLWLCTNHAPMLSDGGDEATWNRLRRVPFNNQIPRIERDPKILAALATPDNPVARAFLVWAVEGAVLWYEQGLGTCSAVDESTAAYQSETDPLQDFIDDCCELDRDSSTTAADLRQAYEKWAVKNGQKYTLSRHRFAAVLRKHECQEHKGTGGTRSWRGIGLTATSDD